MSVCLLVLERTLYGKRKCVVGGEQWVVEARREKITQRRPDPVGVNAGHRIHGGQREGRKAGPREVAEVERLEGVGGIETVW